jgi:hypothetical protein
MSQQVLPLALIALGSLPYLWALVASLRCLWSAPNVCRPSLWWVTGSACGILASLALWPLAVLTAPLLLFVTMADEAAVVLTALCFAASVVRDDPFDDGYATRLTLTYLWCCAAGTCGFLGIAWHLTLWVKLPLLLPGALCAWQGLRLLPDAIPTPAALYGLVQVRLIQAWLWDQDPAEEEGGRHAGS